MAFKKKIVVDGENNEEVKINVYGETTEDVTITVKEGDTDDTVNEEESKENSDEVILVSENLQNKIDEVTIVATKENTEPVVEKKVRIKMREDHKCHVGGEWYYLLKGKNYNVPENVRDILAYADLLLPL